MSRPAEIDGKRYVVVAAALEPYEYECWMSPDDQYVIRRYTARFIGQSAPVSLVDIDYKEDETLGLLPDHWTSKAFMGKQTSQFEGQLVSCAISENVPTALSQFDFPSGTRVNDSVNSTHYIVREDGSHRPISPSELLSRTSYETLRTTDSGMRTAWLYVGGAMILAVLLGWVAIRINGRR